MKLKQLSDGELSEAGREVQRSDCCLGFWKCGLSPFTRKNW